MGMSIIDSFLNPNFRFDVGQNFVWSGLQEEML